MKSVGQDSVEINTLLLNSVKSGGTTVSFYGEQVTCKPQCESAVRIDDDLERTDTWSARRLPPKPRSLRRANGSPARRGAARR